VQTARVDERVHRHQLDGRDAERLEVPDGGGVAEPGVRSAQVLGHVGMAHREAADVVS